MLAVKLIVGGLLLVVIFNLFKAMMVMFKGDQKVPMSTYIGRRLIATACIIVLLLIALATGIITPNPRPY